MGTKSGKKIIKQGLFKSKGYRQFNQYKEEYETKFPEFATRFTNVLLKLLNPEAQAKITDYNLWDNEEDYTTESLSGNKLFIIIHDVNNIDKKLIDKIKTLNNNITFWIETVIITSNEPNSFKQFLESNNIKLKYVYGDATVLKTIIRSNPGFFLMRHGYVRGKWHFNNIPNGQEVLDAIGIKT